ncbi:PEP/pyruvate-binding domain-containing protein [bacterium]|nr:PEP/pyruvate-binding domain-containing protein [bacterium]MBU1985525.1 PEP/pyruvate-binding domain-containing protein [bacterium]
MTEPRKFSPREAIPPFSRDLLGSGDVFTRLGSGELGGKATGLAFIRDTLAEGLKADEFPEIEITIPRLTVLTTDLFDAFMEQNDLYEVALSELSDARIAHAFQRASFPPAFVGDLMGLISKVHQPLAVRSSSLLEDALHHPFAGVYGTKMIPNNQFDVETRFRKLVEAIKFVYASVFFEEAKAYIASIERRIEDEKMAVVIQEIVGVRYGERFYPTLSGVGRSYNFYPVGRARPEQGVVDLALGLGKSIVDGGMCWTYSPAFPETNPPVGSAGELLKVTQREFWAVNMGKPPTFDPTKETEYMIQPGLAEAEADETLRFVASTYDPQADRMNPGIENPGPRAVTFAPILFYEQLPLNRLVQKLLKLCEAAVGAPVEIEFAVTLGKKRALPARFGFLQVRPMMVSTEEVEIGEGEMTGDRVLLASDTVLGNGTVEDIRDVVYVRSDSFEARHTPAIAGEIAAMNRPLAAEKRPYLLIGFGRWGSSDPWLGIPVKWAQISGVKTLVEATLPTMNVELSQGSHFFHNLASFQVSYFSVRHDGPFHVDWNWLENQPCVSETPLVRHIRLTKPLHVRVDGRSRQGVVHHE